MTEPLYAIGDRLILNLVGTPTPCTVYARRRRGEEPWEYKVKYASAPSTDWMIWVPESRLKVSM